MPNNPITARKRGSYNPPQSTHNGSVSRTVNTVLFNLYNNYHLMIIGNGLYGVTEMINSYLDSLITSDNTLKHRAAKRGFQTIQKYA